MCVCVNCALGLLPFPVTPSSAGTPAGPDPPASLSAFSPL